MDALRPDVLIADRFRLVREIGQGGMGSVWLAQHVELDMPCAVKFLKAASNRLARERFTQEAKAAARLRGSHVVQMFDHGLWEGIPYIVMELLEGEDLQRRLRRQGRLAPRACCQMATQIARALRKAHAMGIIHRDLKPENIFLCRDEGGETVKVLDFGLAKVKGELSVAFGSVETQTGTLVGTPYYMSPEQLQGAKTIDHRSDLWSLAVVIYESLVGARPFGSVIMGELAMQIRRLPPPVPSQHNPELPPAFDVWWTKAISRAPEERFGDSVEMISALAVALGEDVPASEPLSMPPQNSSGATPPASRLDVLGDTVDAAPRAASRASSSRSLSSAGVWIALLFAGVSAAGLLVLEFAGRSAPAGATAEGSSVAPPASASAAGRGPPSATQGLPRPGVTGAAFRRASPR